MPIQLYRLWIPILTVANRVFKKLITVWFFLHKFNLIYFSPLRFYSMVCWKRSIYSRSKGALNRIAKNDELNIAISTFERFAHFIIQIPAINTYELKKGLLRRSNYPPTLPTSDRNGCGIYFNACKTRNRRFIEASKRSVSPNRSKGENHRQRSNYFLYSSYIETWTSRKEKIIEKKRKHPFDAVLVKKKIQYSIKKNV